MKLPFNTELLIKYLREEANSEERRLVENWLDQDAANHAFLKQFKRFWKGLEGDSKRVEVDVDQAWLKTSKRFVPKRSIAIYRYVAAAVVVLGIITGAYNWWERNQWIQLESGGRQESYMLADGSKVQLNHHSQLAYRIKDNERLVRLKGEAYFEVFRNVEKPFVINTDNGEVRVLGTSFNVRARERASAERVFVNSGKVAFSDANQKVILIPGQLGVLNIAQGTLKKEVVEESNDLAWKTRKINFENASGDEIKDVIESVYNVKVWIDDKYADRTVNVQFDDQPVDEVMNVIALLMNGKLKHEGTEYRIEK